MHQQLEMKLCCPLGLVLRIDQLGKEVLCLDQLRSNPSS